MQYKYTKRTNNTNNENSKYIQYYKSKLNTKFKTYYFLVENMQFN